MGGKVEEGLEGENEFTTSGWLLIVRRNFDPQAFSLIAKKLGSTLGGVCKQKAIYEPRGL